MSQVLPSSGLRQSSIGEQAQIPRKRKLADLTYDRNLPTTKTPSPKQTPQKRLKSRASGHLPETPKAVKETKAKVEEKRLKRFRNHAPQSFNEKLHRASTQRMIVIGRIRTDTEDCPQEEIEIVGTTGNIYRVTIGRIPTCTCPDSVKGNECKHKVYALHTVLRAPENLQYQLALLKSELEEIFQGAPPIPTNVPNSQDTDGSRKPVEGECPICYMEFDEAENELVWCMAACGNNMHKTCFDQWAASQRGLVVKCVYCRTPWEIDQNDIAAVKQGGELTLDGYVNVAEHFGISRARDYSGYYQPWVRRTIGSGY